MKNKPLLVTIVTGICILIDKYAAKLLAPGEMIKPEFELLWILILYLVLYWEGENEQRKATFTWLALLILIVVTAISVAKIYLYQV